MERGDSCSEGLISFEKVAEVGSGVAVCCRERGAFVVEALVLGPLLVHGVNPAIEGVEAVVARHSGWEDAVEHIDSTGDSVKNVFGVTDAH